MPLPEATVSQFAQRLPSYLPAIYRDDPFLSRYLWAFEQVLLDLEQQIGDLATLFDPVETREDFLPWLSSWVAFTLRADLGVPQQRAFIARIIPLYRRRGTAQNLKDLLSIFIRGTPTISEFGVDDAPHSFRITIGLAHGSPDVLLRQTAIANALIELEKPAHTDFRLDLLFPSMQIGKTSTIGVDTLLGTGGNTDTSGGIAAASKSPSNQKP